MNGATSATVVIATRNRKDDLRRALASCRTQTVVVEVLVLDDGSTDRTAEMVRREFPEVRIVRHEGSKGYIVRRNEGARLAQKPIIFSLDDDAAFATPDVAAETLAWFAEPRVGAVAIPFCNVNNGPQVYQRAPDANGCYVADRFIGTAHALRRDLFLSLGGYREAYVHQGEEGDYCLRMLQAGFVVRLGYGGLIHHFESPQRSLDRTDYYGVRNQIWFNWRNVPWPDVVVRLPASLSMLLGYSFRVGRFRQRTRGIRDGLGQIMLGKVKREPVKRITYRMFRRLQKHGPVRLEEVRRLMGWAS
jgi:GT2 family glycosyltransferase